MTAARPDRVDVAIAGAGPVGLALALAIKQGARSSVLVRDPTLAAGSAPPSGLRAVAVAAGSRRFLARLGIWDELAGRAQPMTEMVLTDARVGAVPPPVFLNFAGEVAPGEPFAHMLLHDDLRQALLVAGRRAGVIFDGCGLGEIVARAQAVTLDPGDPASATARLLVAADGGRSLVRERAGIMTTGWDYGQTAIVATLAHSRDHGGRATQHFLPGGPLAVLPLRAEDGGRTRSSIVWTERRAEADRLLALPDELFIAALRDRIGHGYGELRLEDRPSGYPLRMALARTLIAPRLALVGDAARTIHPLAGQGLNLGLRDAQVLGEGIVDALSLGLDPGAPALLTRYQRSRRPDQVAMAGATDVLNRLFSTDAGPVRLIRDLGLGLVDRSPALKRVLMREAAGVVRTPPPGRRGRFN